MGSFVVLLPSPLVPGNPAFDQCAHLDALRADRTLPYSTNGYYVYAKEHFHHLFQSHFTTVSWFLNQPQCNQLASFLAGSSAEPSLMGLEAQAFNQSIKHYGLGIHGADP